MSFLSPSKTLLKSQDEEITGKNIDYIYNLHLDYLLFLEGIKGREGVETYYLQAELWVDELQKEKLIFDWIRDVYQAEIRLDQLIQERTMNYKSLFYEACKIIDMLLLLDKIEFDYELSNRNNKFRSHLQSLQDKNTKHLSIIAKGWNEYLQSLKE